MHQHTWRPRRFDEPLEDLDRAGSGRLPGAQRCNAVGLLRSDCEMPHSTSDIYCYYHAKVRDELIEPDPAGYPVLPLPHRPYVVLARAQAPLRMVS